MMQVPNMSESCTSCNGSSLPPRATCSVSRHTAMAAVWGAAPVGDCELITKTTTKSLVLPPHWGGVWQALHAGSARPGCSWEGAQVALHTGPS